MKLLHLSPIFFLIVLSLPYKAQTVQSTCLGSTVALQQAYESSDQLTHRNTFLTGNIYKDSVWLNPQTRMRYLRALTAVYNATVLSSRDSIYFVTAFMPELKTVILKADSNLGWVKNLRQNIIPTGNSQLDYLIVKYRLKLDGYYALPAFSCTTCLTISLKSDTSINTNALCNSINQIPSVFYAQPNGFVGDGEDIIDTVYNNYLDLTYYIGWGDCIAGCIHKRYWKFKVNDDCNVEFIKSYGGPPPPWLLTSIDTKAVLNKRISVYPNPAYGLIKLKTESDIVVKTVCIYSLLGQKLLFIKEPSNSIEVSALPEGLYFVCIESDKGNFSERVFIVK